MMISNSIIILIAFITFSQNVHHCFLAAVKNDEDSQITGIYFDCKNKPTGFYRDLFFCDIFHVCVGQKQKKTYSCPQVNDQFYFDDTLKRCEFSNKNAAGCLSNNYYRKVLASSTPVHVSAERVPIQEDHSPWKQYVRMNDQFHCEGNPDGFYSSRWCNVFYRCISGYKYEFLCAKQQNGERLWWNQHSASPKQAPDDESHCAFPCDINRECASPGGVLIDSNETISESTAEVKRIIYDCNSDSKRPVVHLSNNNMYSNTTAAAPVSESVSSEDSSEDIFRLPSTFNSCSGVQGTVFQEDATFCNVFHVCYGGVRKDFLCAKATHNQYELWWNSEKNSCDWPCKVKCENKKVFGSTNTAFEIQAFDFRLNGLEDCVGRAQINARNSVKTSKNSFLNLIGNLGK